MSELVINSSTPGHEPIPDVELSLDGGGGWFLPPGSSTLNVSTSPEGTYRTRWRPPPTGGSSFALRVTARKRGYLKTETRCEVGVDYVARAPRPQGAPLVVACSFSPSTIPFGSTGKLRIWTTSAEGAPVADVSVKAIAEAGVFPSTGRTYIRAQTTVDGRFSTAWTAPSGGGPVVLVDVTGSRSGYLGARGRCEVRIDPTP